MSIPELTNEFLQSLDTPTGRFSFEQLKPLGKLERRF